MLLFFIFLITDLFTILLIWACSRGIGSYRQGMLYGIHIPADALEHPDVAALSASAKKRWDHFTIRHLILGSAVCFFALWNFAAFIIIWAVWFIIYIAGLSYYTTNPMRKMYALKRKNGWFQTQEPHLVHIDTAASTCANEKTPGFLWHLAIFGILFLPAAKYVSASAPPDCLALFLAGTACVLTLVFMAMHYFFTKIRNTVYSKDSSLNLAVNQSEKSAWAKALLAADCLNAVSFLYLLIRIHFAGNLYDADWIIFSLLQLGTCFAIIIPLASFYKKKRELLDANPSPVIADDDVYWKNGYYSNPNDPHLLVQNRLCETNYTFNMARPAGRILNYSCYGIGILALLFVIYSVIPLISIQLEFSRDGNRISISEGGYHCEFSIEEVESASLLKEMPDGRFFRVNGAATDDYNIGRYKNRTLGKCMLFLKNGYSPILQIKLKDKTIFLNSKTEGETEKWYQIFQE